MAICVKEIPGLFFIPNAFTEEEEEYYLEQIKTSKENVCMQIHKATEFGWKFLPIVTKNKDDYLGKFPEWLDKLWEHVVKTGGFPEKIGKEYPDHVLVNKYEVGDGCKKHIDDVNFWNDWVVGVSFGSGCTMEFINEHISKLSLLSYGESIDIYIPPRSIYILSEDARYKWAHSIPYSKTDKFYSDVIDRKIRTSITFRTIASRFLSDDVKKDVDDKKTL